MNFLCPHLTVILYFPTYHILAPLVLYNSPRKKNTISCCSATCPSPSLKESLTNQNKKVFFLIDFRTPPQAFNLNMAQPYPFNYCLTVKFLTQEHRLKSHPALGSFCFHSSPYLTRYIYLHYCFLPQ